MLAIGSCLDEKYEILKQIGQGGTSTVYLAMNTKLNQQWVIKEVDWGKNSLHAERVIKEARLMMKLDHPAIPRIVDIIEKEGNTYIVMDYISGQSLAFELQQKGPLKQEQVISWGIQICNVLCYLHSLNPPIIYHDLKPGNIILKEPERNVKLVDFGEARPCINGNAPGAGKTREYAAPEQLVIPPGKTDERTDIYCFGATMYRLLTGKFPPRLPEVVGSIGEKFPQRNISKGMDRIIQKCMQPNPGQRFQSAEELKNALENMHLWDEDYIKGLKKRVYVTVGTFLCSFGMLFGGIVFGKAAAYVNARDYQQLISTAKSVEYEIRIANYQEAIRIQGSHPEAYIQLLTAYEENGKFGPEESQQFSTLYNQNKASFNPEDPKVLELHYLAGRTYFNLFADGSETIRSRVLKSGEFFQYVYQYGSTEQAAYGIASGYYRLCEFFRIFVLNDGSVQEPSQRDYVELISALKTCLEDMSNYVSGDAAYTRLVIYGHLLEVLNINLNGFYVNGIRQKEIEEILVQMKQAVGEESVTQQVSRCKKEEVLALLEDVMENLQREYERKRSEDISWHKH